MPTNLKVSDYIILPKKKKNIKLKDVFLKEPPKKKKKKERYPHNARRYCYAWKKAQKEKID